MEKILTEQITTEVWELWSMYNNGQINFYELEQSLKKLMTPDKVEDMIQKLESLEG